MKRIVLLVAMVVCIAVSAYSQEKVVAKNAININLGTTVTGLIIGGWGIGGGYERALGDVVAIKLNGDYVSGNIFGTPISYWDAVASLRFYTEAKAVEGFVVDLGGGAFGLNIGTYEGIIPFAQATLGYKWNFGGFFFEPSIGYQLAFAEIAGTSFRAGGIYIGLNFGPAF